MELRDIAAKIKQAGNLIDAGADNRVVRAELADASAMLAAREVAMSPFPVQCECHLKNDPGAKHTQTTRRIAEQAYNNYARYYGRNQSLDDIGKRGGFSCIEIRLLLKGIDPGKREDMTVTTNGLIPPKLRQFLADNPEINPEIKL